MIPRETGAIVLKGIGGGTKGFCMRWIRTSRREKNCSENYLLTHFRMERLFTVGGFLLLKHKASAE